VAIYRLGNESPDNLGFDVNPHRKYFQVYVHDVPADYTRIDNLVERVRLAFKLESSVDEVIEVRYLETSRDLDDAFFGSIMRYIRFQAILSR
jgi:hypothetical protein